jgi:hypothetical protein
MRVEEEIEESDEQRERVSEECEESARTKRQGERRV